MVRLITIMVSVVVVVMLLCLGFFGIALNNSTKSVQETNAQPTIWAISNNLNTTLRDMFPNINTLILTNSNFSYSNIMHTKKELNKDWNSTLPFSYVLLDNLHTRLISLEATQALMNESTTSMHVAPYYAVDGNKSNLAMDEFAITSPIVVVTDNPNGMYFIGTTTSNNNGIIAALNDYQKNMLNPRMKPYINSGTVAQPESLTSNGFTFLENFGWYSQSAIASSGQTVLTMNNEIAVYGTTQTTSNGKYYFIMAYTTSSAKGFSVSNSWYSYWFGNVPFQYESFKPSYFTSTVNWETNTFPGQQLFSWGPQNSGSNAYVTYSVSASASSSGSSVSAGVSYGVQGGIEYSWKDLSTPVSGIAETQNSIGSSASSGVLYTVHPTSVGELNPTLSGGFPPMEFYASFSVTSQTDLSGIPLYPLQYTVNSPTIYMSAY
jgi:hypothetical protein